MKWWIGLLSLGLSAYSDRKTTRMKAGSVHVCLRAKCLARRSAERAFRRLEKRFAGWPGAELESWRMAWSAVCSQHCYSSPLSCSGECRRTFALPCRWARLVAKAGAPVSPTRRSDPRPLDFLLLRAAALISLAN